MDFGFETIKFLACLVLEPRAFALPPSPPPPISEKEKKAFTES
jgi:hypothetical protein